MTEVVLGIDFGGTKIAVGVAAPTGELLASTRLDTDAGAGAAQAVRRALRAGRKLAPDPVAVGVCSPGIVLPDRILLAPNVPGWGELRLAELVAAEFGAVPVAVGTDAKAAGLAEYTWGVLGEADPAVYLSLGTGLAAAILIGGRVLGGANGAAGEFGYNLRGRASAEAFASGVAPLEEAVGGIGLGRRASSLLGAPTSAAQLFALAPSDSRAAALVDEALDELAVHVANLAIAVDPELMAVGGGFLGAAEVVLPALRRRLAQAVPFAPKLVAAHFGADASLRGALALALAELA
jgi:predicted NBD/HSP70 family sugar kinase